MIEQNYGVALLALGDLREARAVQVHAKERAHRLGLAYATRLVDGALACICYHSGEWDEARAIAERVIAAADSAATHGDTIDAHAVCGGWIWRRVTASWRHGTPRRRSRLHVRSASHSISFRRSGSKRRFTFDTAARWRERSCSRSCLTDGGSVLRSPRSRSPALQLPHASCRASGRPSSLQRRITRCPADGYRLRISLRLGAQMRRQPSTQTSVRCRTKRWPAPLCGTDDTVRGYPVRSNRYEGSEMGAGSKFDQPLTLIQDGHKVVACGPLRFHGCDVRAEVTIELVQPGHGRAVKTKMFPNRNFDDDRCDDLVGDEEDEWMMTATVEPEFMHSGLRSVGWGTPASSLLRRLAHSSSPTGSSHTSGVTALSRPCPGWATRTRTTSRLAGSSRQARNDPGKAGVQPNTGFRVKPSESRIGREQRSVPGRPWDSRLVPHWCRPPENACTQTPYPRTGSGRRKTAR